MYSVSAQLTKMTLGCRALWRSSHQGVFHHFARSECKTDINPDIKQVTQIWLYQFSGAHCHCRGGSSLGAGWVNRCEGVSTKAHLFSVCWTKRLRARWIEGPWGAPNSSVTWLLNSLTMLCLKASGKWSFQSLAAEHMTNGAAAADLTLQTSVAFVNIWWAGDNYALWLLL